MSRVWKRTLLLVTLSLLCVGVLWISPLQGVERSAGLSALYAFRGTRNPPQSVVIVALDAQSAQQLGVPRRPDLWPRRLHAQMVSGLSRSGAAAIGFDLLFEQPGDAADDAAFATALREAGNVVLAERVVRHLIHAEAGDVLAGVDRLIRPTSALAEAAWVTAPFVLPKTLDGVFEFWTFPTGAGGNPSMPVRLFEQWSRLHGQQSAYPVGAGDRLALNLYGPFGTLPIMSYADALERLNAGEHLQEVKDKVVLVGLAEPNQSLQFDAYHTPYSTPDGVDINGVELAATAIANMVEGSSLKRWTGWEAFALILGWTVVLSLIWGVARAEVATFTTLGAVVLFGGGALAAFSSHHVWLPVVFPVLVVPLLVGGIGMVLKYRFARGRHRRLQQLLGADQRSRSMNRLAGLLESRPEGSVVRAVCLSSDVAAYTTRSEGLTPAEARDMLTRYLAHFMPIVESHGGDVTDIVGDSLMCLWVVGQDESRACQQAVQAALELDERMNRSGLDGTLPTRFGLHLGEVFFGELGVGERMEIRPVGDVVNTASRVQSACKPLGVTVLASEDVARHLDAYPMCRLGLFRFKGKTDPLPLSAFAGDENSAELHAQFEEALTLFCDSKLPAAVQAFDAIRRRWPEHAPTRFYLRVCETPALHADGVVVLTRA